jgi:hypothetical protein
MSPSIHIALASKKIVLSINGPPDALLSAWPNGCSPKLVFFRQAPWPVRPGNIIDKSIYLCAMASLSHIAHLKNVYGKRETSNSTVEF